MGPELLWFNGSLRAFCFDSLAKFIDLLIGFTQSVQSVLTELLRGCGFAQIWNLPWQFGIQLRHGWRCGLDVDEEEFALCGVVGGASNGRGFRIDRLN